MNPSIFEALMLLCFGAAWPFSIYRMIKTKKSHGKSVQFLMILLAGYFFGLLFQYFGQRNGVIFLYLLNTLLVSLDLFLTIQYGKNVSMRGASLTEELL